MSEYFPLPVRAVIEETPDAKSLVLDVPEHLAEQFRYRPGQFLTLRISTPDRGVRRCYSMSSTPARDQGLRVTVKRVSGGYGSNWLCDRVKPGDHVEALPPSGVFTPRELGGDFLLFAAGSGVTPVFSILRSALACGSGHICLVYANRDEKSVIFRQALNELAREYPSRLQVIHWLDSVQGVPTQAQLASLAMPWSHAEAFICGPAAFMDTAVAALEQVGMASDRVHVERFISLPDEKAEAIDTAALSVSGLARTELQEARIEIALNGAEHVVVCRGNETILDAALRAGLDAPHSCRAGMCASCMCQVTDGQVHLLHNDVLDEKDLAKAWTLSCQAVPATDRVRIKFPE